MMLRLFQALALLVLSASTCLAEMSKPTALSAGSFFAAASQCEERDLIARDQTRLLLEKLEPYLSDRNRRWLREGLAEGGRRAAVFLTQQRKWAAFSADTAGCERVQAVLDEYKATLIGDTPKP
jgi:hypothetical protein